MGGSIPGADVAGVRPKPVQMREGGPSPGADVVGVSPVPARMWQCVSLLVPPQIRRALVAARQAGVHSFQRATDERQAV